MASLYYSKLITRTYVMIVTRTETNNLPKNIKVCPTPWVIAYYPDERMARQKAWWAEVQNPYPLMAIIRNAFLVTNRTNLQKHAKQHLAHFTRKSAQLFWTGLFDTVWVLTMQWKTQIVI